MTIPAPFPSEKDELPFQTEFGEEVNIRFPSLREVEPQVQQILEHFYNLSDVVLGNAVIGTEVQAGIVTEAIDGRIAEHLAIDIDIGEVRTSIADVMSDLECILTGITNIRSLLIELNAGEVSAYVDIVYAQIYEALSDRVLAMSQSRDDIQNATSNPGGKLNREILVQTAATFSDTFLKTDFWGLLDSRTDISPEDTAGLIDLGVHPTSDWLALALRGDIDFDKFAERDGRIADAY